MTNTSIVSCPHCRKEIEVRVSYASGPKSKPENVDTGDLGQLLDSIDESTLTGRDLEFFQKSKSRFEQYGAKTMMSPKQMQWLHDLAGKGF